MKVLISGGTKGIGNACLKGFLKIGYECIVVSREVPVDNRGDYEHIKCDFSDIGSVKKLCNMIKTKNIDILINNVGINEINDIENHSADSIQEMIQVNCLSHSNIISSCIPNMKRKKFGRIVNISSIWAQKSLKGRSIYSASKAYIEGLTQSLSCELGAHGIIINAVSPGFIETDLTNKNMSESVKSEIRKRCPLGRLGKPKEVADLVIFLASPRNTYITGTSVLIDGGYSKHG